MIGWAGWDFADQARALTTLYARRRAEDHWGARRLAPLLAGLLELVPWLRQWHNDGDGGFGDAVAIEVAREIERIGLTTEEVLSWRPD